MNYRFDVNGKTIVLKGNTAKSALKAAPKTVQKAIQSSEIKSLLHGSNSHIVK